MISVITPNYNGERWLDEYFDSLANQTLPQDQMEVIFADDGSTDGSRAITESYAGRLPGLKPIWHEHIGRPGELRNIAIRQAIGEYVLFLDSDDFLGQEALERLRDFSSAHPSDVVAFQLEGIDRHVPRSMLEKTIADADPVGSGLYKTLGIWKMVSRTFIDRHELRFDPSIRRGDDALFFLEAMLKAKRLSVLSGYPFYMLRGRDDGSSITQDEWKHIDRVEVMGKSVGLIADLAQDRKTYDHFMIRPFNSDALEMFASPSMTTQTSEAILTMLRPHWKKGVAELIYTDENRRRLTDIFGEPSDD